ncbi:MAG: hypothetical protein M3O09_01965 [Acidobacteriota bacterium]|jgi:hypothetical protein|nr:hypothetical protein [Acidobacteriota bacterium]
MYKGTLIDDLIAAVAKAEGQVVAPANPEEESLTSWYALTRHEIANLDSLVGVA